MGRIVDPGGVVRGLSIVLVALYWTGPKENGMGIEAAAR
jgi:hypothetical protein